MTCIDRSEVLRYLGYAGQCLDVDLEQRIETIISLCEQELTPRCVHATYLIDGERSTAGRVMLVGCDLALEGESIEKHLAGAREVTLLACTLGALSERSLRRLSATSPTDAMLYSAAASALVEAAADEAQARLAQEALRRDLYQGSRFSPGYGDFPLAIQPEFLAVLDAPRRIGLTATKDFLLVPTKSITAVIGLFEEDLRGESPPSSCAACAAEGHCLLALQGRTCRD